VTYPKSRTTPRQRAHWGYSDPADKALPFRFSGNARLTVDPRKKVTSFSEPPWNLRRILGTPNDPEPGPQVNRMQYQLLYGLSCDTSQPAFRLADLIARVGQIAGVFLALVIAWGSWRVMSTPPPEHSVRVGLMATGVNTTFPHDDATALRLLQDYSGKAAKFRNGHPSTAPSAHGA
jgi:hypothetical protein